MELSVLPQQNHPAEFIDRIVEAHGGQYVKEFAQQMFTQLGMQDLVLSAHHDTTGSLSIARQVYQLLDLLDFEP